MQLNEQAYGVGMNSYCAAGELEGITKLVNDFYDEMDQLPEAQVIRRMHPDDLTESKKKLAFFLSGWLGGPKLYREHYGEIRIPMFHRHLPIGKSEKDAWLRCMEIAIEAQPFQEPFKSYLLIQLRVPAERVQHACGASIA